MTTPSDDSNDPGMIEKLRSWVEGNYPAEIDSELLAWLHKHHPECMKVSLNEELLQAEIKRLREQGIEITPDTFQGIKLTAKPKLEIEGSDPSLN